MIKIFVPFILYVDDFWSFRPALADVAQSENSF